MKLLLFDIDGTLLKPMGVGKKAFIKSLEQRYGKFKKIPNFAYDGLLDIEIVNRSLEMMGVKATIEQKKEIIKDYVLNLKFEIPKNIEEWLCPNVPLILEKAIEKNFALSVVTGNVREAAFLKLSSAKLDHFFPSGAFGDDADERWKLVEISRKKAEKIYNKKFQIEETFVIGDSLKDIYAARKNRAKAVSVATGQTPYEKLKEANPDYILKNFLDTPFLDEI